MHIGTGDPETTQSPCVDDEVFYRESRRGPMYKLELRLSNYNLKGQYFKDVFL